MAPAKKKVTNKSKDKYSVNTAESQTNLDNIDNTNSVNSDEILTDIESTNNTFNLDNIDNETLRSLKGYGLASKPPEFSHDHTLFSGFQSKLKHYLLVNNVLKFLEAPEISQNDNITLYVAIANCLKNEALELVQQESFGDGQRSYKLLCQKYLGNTEARKTNALFALLTLTQGENESITSLVTRVDQIKHQLDEFGTINDPCLYTVQTLIALNNKYDIFFANMSGSKTLPWEEFKVYLESHETLRKIKKDRNTVGTGSVNTTFKVNFKKHLKSKLICDNCYGVGHKAKDCYSDKWCNHCRNGSHNEHMCRNKHNNDGRASSRRGSHASYSDRRNTTRGRYINRARRGTPYGNRGGYSAGRGIPDQRGRSNSRGNYFAGYRGRGNRGAGGQPNGTAANVELTSGPQAEYLLSHLNYNDPETPNTHSDEQFVRQDFNDLFF